MTKLTEETKATKATDDKVNVGVDRSKYQKSKTAKGKPSLNNGDRVATALAGVDVGAVYTIAAKVLDEDILSLTEKYGHLNSGMQRMALGNRIRAAVRKDDALEEPTGLADLVEELAESERADVAEES